MKNSMVDSTMTSRRSPAPAHAVGDVENLLYPSWMVTALVLLLLTMVCMSYSRDSVAAGAVTSIMTHDQATSPSQYSINGQTFSWGVGTEQVLDGFFADGRSYRLLSSADRVEVVRVDRGGDLEGAICSVFAERGSDFTQLLPSFPGDGSTSGKCDLARMLTGRVVNRGVLNIFSNIGEDRKNVERVDFIFDNGSLAPVRNEMLDLTGHLVSEKRGNNPIQIAAILQLNKGGEPAQYGPLIKVRAIGCDEAETCYSETPLFHDYSFFESNRAAPNGPPVYARDSTETVTMGFVSLKVLGVSAGQRYFGFSYFPKDVDANVHQLTDATSFPDDTADNDFPGDGADIYGGMSGFFIPEQLGGELGSVITASVFVDTSQDGVHDDAESGVEGISLSLYNDTDSNGVFDPAIDVPAGEATTDPGGQAHFIGVADGLYFLVLDDSDPDLPNGLELPPGSEVMLVMTPLADGETVNFAFVDSGSSTDGTTTDGTATDGTATDGTATDGTATDGTATDGTATDGTATDGTATDGTATDGTATDGTATDGTATDGTATDGTATDGTATDGTATDGTATDGTATDGAATDGTATDGTATDGTTTDGTTTDGTTTDGTTTDGNPLPPDNDGTLPVATNDSAVAQQNMARIIDVLANDVDPAGGGLTIVDVSAVENGTASIVGKKVVFVPALGFLGTTAFTYTIEDSKRVQDSGTVSVTVVQFSDLNNDGVNDFEQCGGCTSLDLITGVHGSGLGTLSLELLMLLAFFGLGLHYRRVEGESK